MSLSVTVNAMAAAGCSAEQIAAVVARLDEERRAKARAGNAERQRRYRDRHNGNNAVTSHNGNNAVTQSITPLQAVTGRDKRDDASRARDEGDLTTNLDPRDNHIDSSLTNAPPALKTKKQTPREVLETALSPATAEDVLDHRQKLKVPLTARAARMLVDKLMEFPEGPEKAAEIMILKGWRGFETKWVATPPSRAGPATNGHKSPLAYAEEFKARNRQQANGHDPSSHFKTIDGNYTAADEGLGWPGGNGQPP